MQRDLSISYVRVIAMFMILICHLGTQYGNGVIAELFVIGVEIFFFISGYLNNTRNRDSVTKWEWGRIRRLYLPVIIFGVILFIAAFLSGYEDSYWGMLPCVGGVYGISKIIPAIVIEGFPGLTHLWFVTVMLLCYLLVPVFDKINEVWKRPRALLGCLVAFQVLLGFFNVRISYMVIFYVGYLTRLEDIRYDEGKKLALINIILLLGLIIRLLGQRYLDDSLLYLSFIIPFSNNAIASVALHDARAVLRWGKRLFTQKSVVHLLDWFDSISYEVYIVHYTFIAGIFTTFILDCGNVGKVLLFFLFSFVSAVILHWTSERVLCWGRNKREGKSK